jgi:DNA-binding transcriptional LysR family regulator
LLDRNAHPMQLTPAGRFFYEQIVQTLARLMEVAAGTRRIAKGQRSWFGVGFVPSVLYGWLPDLIKSFRSTVPDVELGLSELITVQQAEALKAGRIDVGFGRLQLDDPTITSEVLMEEAVVAAFSAGHRLCAGRRVSLAQLSDEPLVLYPARPRPSYADEVIRIFRSRDLPIKIAMEANELQTAIGMVAAGVGVALVPESVKRLHRNDVSYRPLTDSGVVSPIIMNFRSGDQSPELARFRELVKGVLAQH